MRIPLLFSIPIFALSAGVVWQSAHSCKRDFFDIATFIVLSLTFIVLVVYANDAHDISKVTTERWKREDILGLMYSMDVVGEKGGAGRTRFRIHNTSKLVARAKVRCNFKIYGEPVDNHPAFNGSETWYVLPQQIVQGWFEVRSLLETKGRTVDQMIREQTAANQTNQLTMDLEVEFRNELDERRILPPAHHFFRFDDWNWEPVFTKKEDWA